MPVGDRRSFLDGMSLPRLAVNRPVTTAMVLLSLLVLGGISFTRIPLAYLPDVDFPGVFVTVPYPNASPQQVEREIVQPLEEALATIPGARRIRSTATADSANLQLEFTWGETVDVARAKVFEAVEDARRDLPSDVKEIYVNTFSTTQIPILEARISAPGMDLSANYDRLERRIADPIRRVPGVARVDLDGVEPREVRINLRLDRLAAHRVDLGEVTERVSGMNRNVSLGRIRTDGVVTPVRGFGALSAIDEIGGLPLNDRGLTVADIAEVTYQEPPIPFGRHLDDETAIGLTVYKSAEANTVEVATAVSELIETEIAADPALSGINLFVWEDQAEEITSGLSGIRTEGLLGALLAVAVLFLFLRRVDTTSIVSLTIPMSIIATAIVLYFAGRSLNVLSMMGMMLGIGLLVDDAIVVLESVVREHGRGIPAKLAAISGAQAVSRRGDRLHGHHRRRVPARGGGIEEPDVYLARGDRPRDLADHLLFPVHLAHPDSAGELAPAGPEAVGGAALDGTPRRSLSASPAVHPAPPLGHRWNRGRLPGHRDPAVLPRTLHRDVLRAQPEPDLPRLRVLGLPLPGGRPDRGAGRRTRTRRTPGGARDRIGVQLLRRERGADRDLVREGAHLGRRGEGNEGTGQGGPAGPSRHPDRVRRRRSGNGRGQHVLPGSASTGRTPKGSRSSRRAPRRG